MQLKRPAAAHVDDFFVGATNHVWVAKRGESLYKCQHTAGSTTVCASPNTKSPTINISPSATTATTTTTTTTTS